MLSSLPVLALSSIYLITPIAGAKQPGGALGGALKYIPVHTNGIVINTLEPKNGYGWVYSLLIGSFHIYTYIYGNS